MWKSLSCALLRARQRFSWRCSLWYRRRCKQVRSRSSGRVSQNANGQSAREQGKESPTLSRRDETHASAAPRTRRAAVRLRPGDWTKKPHKKPWGSPPLRTTAAPRQDVSGHDRQLPPHHTPSRKHPPRSRWRGASAAPRRLRCVRVERRRRAARRNRRARAPLHHPRLGGSARGRPRRK